MVALARGALVGVFAAAFGGFLALGVLVGVASAGVVGTAAAPILAGGNHHKLVAGDLSVDWRACCVS